MGLRAHRTVSALVYGKIGDAPAKLAVLLHGCPSHAECCFTGHWDIVSVATDYRNRVHVHLACVHQI